MTIQNKTAEFLANEYSWSKASLELHDMQPLSGGVRVLLPSWTSGELYVTRFARDGAETKYRIPLKWSATEKQALIQLCVEQDLLTIKPAERLGLPDEARPSLTLRNSKRQSHTVAKWAGVQDARFDAIYRAMLALAERSAGQRPIPKRFTAWQKVGVLVLLLVGFLLLSLAGYGLARPLVAVWWPERFGLLLVLLLHLMAFLLLGLRVLAWWERRQSRWDRAYTHPWTLIGVNLCFFVAGVGAWGLAETAVAVWRMAVVLTAEDERFWYAVLGYGGVFTAVLVLLTASRLIRPLQTVVNERF